MPATHHLDTCRGPARAVVHAASAPAALVVLLHGAGTDTSAAPFPALADALAAAGLTAVRFDQPYRVAGRRVPDAARFLDAALLDALREIRALGAGLPLGVVGRSSGARVACRTAAAAGTRAIVALGFPWRPPGAPSKPHRGDELRLGGRACPVLVVQGDRDPFGRPTRTRGVRTRVVPGMAHTPSEPAALGTIGWLARTLTAPARGTL